MPLAVTHILLTIIAVDLYRDYIVKNKKDFTLWTLFIAGVAGILPDIDIPLSFIFSSLSMELPAIISHGGLTHTPFFSTVFLIPMAVSWLMKNNKFAIIFGVIAFGIMFHFALDYTLGGGDEDGVMLMYPLSEDRFKVGLLLGDEFFASVAALDAVILLLWLFHEERKHKIRDFI